ncbi:hypothetical protein [Pseudomonas nicosulfuronedens]
MDEQTEAEALLKLLALGQKEIDEGRFSDAMAFLDEVDERCGGERQPMPTLGQ